MKAAEDQIHVYETECHRCHRTIECVVDERSHALCRDCLSVLLKIYIQRPREPEGDSQTQAKEMA